MLRYQCELCGSASGGSETIMTARADYVDQLSKRKCRNRLSLRPQLDAHTSDATDAADFDNIMKRSRPQDFTMACRALMYDYFAFWPSCSSTPSIFIFATIYFATPSIRNRFESS